MLSRPGGRGGAEPVLSRSSLGVVSRVVGGVGGAMDIQ